MPFHVTPSKTVNNPMMIQERKFGYYADDKLQALEMPYEGEEISMLVLLPRKTDGLDQLEESLSGINLNRWVNGLRTTKLQIFFPKFKTISEFNLGEKLKSLGMINAFNPNMADFSGMDGTKNLYISAIVHKAFVEIDEEGTEAAASTAVGIGVTSMRQQFRADHPFIFIIRQRDTGNFLLMGRVMDPTAFEQ